MLVLDAKITYTHTHTHTVYYILVENQSSTLVTYYYYGCEKLNFIKVNISVKNLSDIIEMTMDIPTLQTQNN